jgi:hypothetical protein
LKQRSSICADGVGLPALDPLDDLLRRLECIQFVLPPGGLGGRRQVRKAFDRIALMAEKIDLSHQVLSPFIIG